MTRNRMEFYTPLPGRLIPEEIAAAAIEKFEARYKMNNARGFADNVPAACALQGRRDSNYLDNEAFRNRRLVFFYFDNPAMLREANPGEIAEYYRKREPWEDYDFCVFDESLKWCVGVTHNDDIIVVESD